MSFTGALHLPTGLKPSQQAKATPVTKLPDGEAANALKLAGEVHPSGKHPAGSGAISRRERARSPEQDLWRAVIRQAFEDAGLAARNETLKRSGAPPGMASLSEASIAKAREEARRFLMAERGTWAKQRREIADMAGMDPDQIRNRAIELHQRKTRLPGDMLPRQPRSSWPQPGQQK